ncbi:hypothetical protein GLOTRDRAFT_115833 [Gloeophyllum trabeum ATCC 11539]|uniref:Uncharacterized protein n=1 Tax=Gloeophyllum trabeum (strain ATCC 11539 / FP-39264 / Madison 617) TaxID=670483 RepID=S7Q9S5_GLOTA|nr:uncharacterized protein GLOTRDRAFT_115833 [Gloeophyllum trabeum ATCC 11539]EPQ56671.1 hypothetical protein GLOTRDRAFT_115833 [Gloeophyllum trabeum ATCC 11539]
MVFSFTFSFTVPEIPNPFAAAKRQVSPPRCPDSGRQTLSRRDVGPRQRRLPSPSASTKTLPLNRKRGWEPALAEPSQATTDQTSTSGYLDTPAKYRDMAPSRDEETEVEDMVAELPPAKRRRTLAGSIVSTALSAALIGTAVGLTVYRLWRDRGKEPEQLPPPPPYQERDWVPVQSAKSPEPPAVQVTPSTPQHNRRSRPAGSRRAATRHRRTPTRPRIQTSTRSASPAWHPEPRFDFSQQAELPTPDVELDVDEEMDWIGGKISQLIEEGKKALGKEVVVMSDAQEDEVDDGTGNWEEESAGPSTASRRGSMRRSKRPRAIHPPPAYFAGSASASSSPRVNQFERGHSHGVSGISRGASVESQRSQFQEDPTAWESPELRESMQRAREMYLKRRS